MDNEVNGSKSYLLWWGKWCLPKNAICVICSVLHIDFRLLIYQFLINRFLVHKCKLVRNPTNTGKIRQYVHKVLFSGVFATGSIFQDGAWLWMKMVEMDENGI